ncbi:hypothetical protein IGI04_026967 [Brassica rapa subsp. trilocularis]|nr:hypothetical protein IGI04_026967 [Brassica rapa subsp. trilocularis]CAF2162938.1 unnamed protein product [Brassica napus]CAG7902114.1 unnamed protein product [Brassica rapa]CAG7902119.1 unnamed protein product [Brassica rapa]VDC98027.1 unnamed protein product [Brassica rapa]
MEKAINKSVTIAELIKRRIPGIHQHTSIGSIDITDIWESKEEGLLPIETTRHVLVITITLSKKELNTSAVGYQCPIPIELGKPFVEIDYEGRGIFLPCITLQHYAMMSWVSSANPVADAESIVPKAIRDGAMDATIDHKNGCMVSNETGDIYSTNEPQTELNSRIAFCLNMHNKAVRALRCPPNTRKEKESDEKRRKSWLSIWLRKTMMTFREG